MGRAQGAVLGLLFLATCTLAQNQHHVAHQLATSWQQNKPAAQQQQQQQAWAPAPATTFTNMAQQVAQLSQFPNNPGYDRSARKATTEASPADASMTLQATGGSNSATATQAQKVPAQQYEWAPKAAPTPQASQASAQTSQSGGQNWQPSAQNWQSSGQNGQSAGQNWQPSAQSGQASNTQANNVAQQQNPNMPPQPPQPLPPQFSANAPQPNPQGTINTIGSVVQAAGSLASAQQALSSAGSAAGSGDILQTVGQAAQAVQAVQKAAGDVGNVQKSIQTNGAYVASPIPQAVPSPPTININVPGLGGNRGVQGPPGISYTAPATQNAAQGTAYGAQTGGQTGTQQSSDPINAIGSALAQAAFGGGLNQPAAGLNQQAANTATLQAKNMFNNALGRRFA